MKLAALTNQYPLLLGTWILRSTNDIFLEKGISYVLINYDDSIKFRTLYKEGFIGIKKSISGNILNVTEYENDKYSIDIAYSQVNKYSYSIFGVEIPEFKAKTQYSTTKRKINVTLHDKTLIVKDYKTPLYYLFDLQIGRVHQPFVETGINNLIFTQTFSFVLNLILAKILHNLFFVD